MMILETFRAELAVGFIEKEKSNESAKTVFIKGGANVDDDFHDDWSRRCSCLQAQPLRNNPHLAARCSRLAPALTCPFPFLWRSLLSLQFLARRSRWTRQQ